MSKSEIIDSIFENVKWNEGQKSSAKNVAMKKNLAYLERVYASYVVDKGNVKFYATLISM